MLQFYCHLLTPILTAPMAREIARDADQSRSPQYAQVKSALKEIPKGTFLCRENVIQYYIWAT